MIETKYGDAYINNGYVKITSNEYGFRDEYLHRLLMAEQLGCGIPSEYHVHHIDGDKTNNNPGNLMLLSKSNHHKLHMNKTNHPRWNHGLIDEAGGINFISASKNKGMTMQDIADEVGYSNVSTVFHYLDKRGLRWNQL